jgi:hypothetical protein
MHAWVVCHIFKHIKRAKKRGIRSINSTVNQEEKKRARYSIPLAIFQAPERCRL